MDTTMRGDGDTQKPLAKCFSFRCDRLKKDDVLLCTDPDEKMSKAIRLTTGGTFSHAAICTIAPLFIEADLPTVAEFSLDGRLLARRTSAKLLRLKPSVTNARAIAEAAASAAQEFQVGRYDRFGAVASVFGGLPDRQVH
jgi:hypothetical protein